MSLQEIVYQGDLVSTGSPQYVNIPAGFDQFVLRNVTTLAAASGVIESRWNSTMAAASAELRTLGGGTITDTIITTGGFTYQDTATATIGAQTALSGTEITAADPAVCTATTTPLVGDIVRIFDTTTMLQIAGMDFSVTAVSAGANFTLGYLDASGFAGAATAGNYRILPYDNLTTPTRRYITKITAANPCVITLSVTHGYVVGQKVIIRNGKDRNAYRFGMSQIDGLTATITAINTTNNTITTDIDSSAFDAWAFPTSAVAAAGVTFPHIVPAGETADILTGAYTDSGTRRIHLGSSVDGTSGDVFEYTAIRTQK